jgi:hypothetical protein
MKTIESMRMSTRNRTVLPYATRGWGAAFGLALLSAAASLRADITVFSEGRVRLPVIVAADAAPDERAAAVELARVLSVMSGLEWPVRTRAGGDGFVVGRTRDAARSLVALPPAVNLLAPKADEIGPDGFRIRTLGGRVYIEGATPEATAYAVAWLLQREGGVRWYAPGALGEVIPRRDSWILPELRVVREPAYVSRDISGVDEAWARHNGLRGRIEYSHNLNRVIPSTLGAAHPEWFPLFQGKRLLPTSKGDFNWQPNLLLPEVAERAAQQAAEAFALEPGRASFSLGMNDSVRFDQSEATQAAVAPLGYFRGKPDYSPLVFGFMNRAAGALGATHPDKYLGCLAYFWCENPPAFPVSPQVVPYVTTDRTQFYDPAYRAADYALMSRWGRSGVRAFGLWEYAEGDAYVVPRVPHAMLAESVREGWWRGARGYMGECGPHGGFDAFKVWMLAQLLWEPDRPLAELEEDFFTGWYGPAAGPMRAFFARCEAQWMAQEGPPWWIKFYKQQDQVLLYPPEVCRELRALLEEAAAAAGGRQPREEGRVQNAEAGTADIGTADIGTAEGEYGERPDDGSARVAHGGSLLEGPAVGNRQAAIENRVALTSRAFAVTEAAVEFGRVRSALAAAEETITVAELAGLLGQLQRARGELERAAQAAVASVDGVAAMATADVNFMLRNDPVPRLLAALGRRDPVAPMAVLTELLVAGEPVPAHWSELAAACANGRFAQLNNRLANSDFAGVAAGRQGPVFLYPRWGELPSGWEMRGMATEAGRVGLVGTAGQPDRALRIEGAWESQLSTTVPAAPGGLHVVEARMRGQSSPGADAALFLVFMTAEGRLTGEYRTQALPKGESGWRSMLLAATAPADAAWVSVGVSALRQPAGDWLEVAGVELRN